MSTAFTILLLLIDVVLIVFTKGADTSNNIFVAQILNILTAPLIIMFLTKKTVISNSVKPEFDIKHYALFDISDIKYLNYEFKFMLKRVEFWALYLFPIVFFLVFRNAMTLQSLLLIGLNLALLLIVTYLSVQIKNYHYKFYWILIQMIGLSFVFACRFLYRQPFFLENFRYFIGYSALLIFVFAISIFIFSILNKKVIKNA